jgi:hypothetical protein
VKFFVTGNSSPQPVGCLKGVVKAFNGEPAVACADSVRDIVIRVKTKTVSNQPHTRGGLNNSLSTRPKRTSYLR